MNGTLDDGLASASSADCRRKTWAEADETMAAHVRDDGFVVTGFHVNRELSLEHFDECVAAAGLVGDDVLGAAVESAFTTVLVVLTLVV